MLSVIHILYTCYILIYVLNIMILEILSNDLKKFHVLKINKMYNLKTLLLYKIQKYSFENRIYKHQVDKINNNVYNRYIQQFNKSNK